MKDCIFTKNGIKYFYHHGVFSFLPTSLFENTSMLEKKKFWVENKNMNDVVNFEINYEAEKARYNLANIRQIVIEVTDACNLQCYYCTYGRMYNNYDKRNTKMQSFDLVKRLIDSCLEYWGSNYNSSFDKTKYISFYGGEPLLNMNLIKQIISYIETQNTKDIKIAYNMTTNGVLLDKYMDFLEQKNISLLISLDGDRFNSSYRTDSAGNESFFKVYNNMKLLHQKYPVYFKEKINFNVVLHNRNSVEKSCSFIFKEFNKMPRIGNLTMNGLSDYGKKVINKIYNDKFDSFSKASEFVSELGDFKYQNTEFIYFHAFIKGFVNNIFDSYLDLFEVKRSSIIPTGTCLPLERKFFFTVNGKLLPCEKVGQNCSMGTIKDGKFDFDKICAFYTQYYKSVVKQCEKCLLKRSCGQCMFLFEEENKQLICPEFLPINRANKYFAAYLYYAENNIKAYEDLLNMSHE